MSARTIPQVALRVVVDDCVDVAAQTVRVDGRQIPPALKKGRGLHTRAGQGPQLCHRPAAARHRQALAAQDALDDVATVVAQVPDRHLTHSCAVSQVRR
jgi:hypothetical protein